MTKFLTVEQVIALSAMACGGQRPEIRDWGLLDSAVHRPQASLFGEDAYPDLFSKAAALLHSLAANHPFVDGNKRVAWHSTAVFCRDNGAPLYPNEDDAYKLMIDIATGALEDVDAIADQLAAFAGKQR